MVLAAQRRRGQVDGAHVTTVSRSIYIPLPTKKYVQQKQKQPCLALGGRMAWLVDMSHRNWCLQRKRRRGEETKITIPSFSFLNSPSRAMSNPIAMNLWSAALLGQLEEVSSLLSDNPGLDVNWANKETYQFSALHIAASAGHSEVVKLLWRTRRSMLIR